MKSAATHHLADCYNIEHLRRLAQRRLPAPLFHFMEGGADDEWSLRNNTAAFDRYELIPEQLRNISDIDTSATVLGLKLRLPLLLAPTGMSRLFHHEAETAVARAAQQSGVLYTLSTMATTRLEDISTLGGGPWMYQIYIFKDRALTAEFVERCKAARYSALCLTVDTPVAGNRERDRLTGMTMPPRLTLKSLASFVRHPGWTLHLLKDRNFELRNVAHRVDVLSKSTVSVIDYVNSQFDRTVTWDDVAWLAQKWGGPFVVKGLQSAADAERAMQAGASAVMISNHGGRQLDATAAPIDCVTRIRDRVGDQLEIIVDGGVRRGTHLLKALALGANACSIGRPYLYGLAAGGQAGVARSLDLLRSEVERDMALLGCRSTQEIGPRHLRQGRLDNI